MTKPLQALSLRCHTNAASTQHLKPCPTSLTHKNVLSFFPTCCCEEYFSQHLGEYENVLGALEDLNKSILKAMDKTKKVRYEQAENLMTQRHYGIYRVFK